MEEGGEHVHQPRGENTLRSQPARPGGGNTPRARVRGDEGGEEGRGQIRKGLVMTWSWEPCR